MDKDTKANNLFICNDGTKLQTINDLIIELERNTRENSDNFEFHTRENNNDFANWIKSEFGLVELGDKIMNIKNVNEMINTINDYFKNNFGEKNENKKIIAQDSQILEVKKSIDSISKSSEEKLDLINKIKKDGFKESIKMQKEVELVNDEYSKIYNEISQARKEGKNMFIPELKLRSIKPKIKYFETTRNIEDYEKIKLLFDDIRAEIDDEINHKTTDIREEILAASKEEVND